jgi:cytoskeleton protein RodZ
MNGEIQTDVGHGTATAGAVLAAARVEKGLAVEQVAGQLRLSSSQIKAIEADDFDALSGTVFARGYVRNYARLLGMNAAPLLSAMAQQEPSAGAPSDDRMLRDAKGVVMDPVRFRGLPIATAIIAGVVGALAFYEFVLNDARIAKPGAQVRPVPVVVRDAAISADPAVDSRGVAEPTGSPATIKGEAKPPTSTPAPRGLHFLFSRESWVEVRDGVGNILFSQINLPGTERLVQGDPPFKVVVGGAHGVHLAYNGSPVDLAAHATEDVARLRIDW